MKRPGLYAAQVTRVFSNLPQLKLLNKIRVNIVIFLNCDLLEFEIQHCYKKPYGDYVSFRFL